MGEYKGNKNKNYTSYALWLSLIVIVLLILASAIPNINIGCIQLKSINILSDIIAEDSVPTHDTATSDTLMEEDIDLMLMTTTDSLITMTDIKSVSWTTPGYDLWDKQSSQANTKRTDTSREDAYTISTRIEIEDFGKEMNPEMKKFYTALVSRNKIGRPVRIAFLGDSFIEGDIVTADIRESLQRKYGGVRVGFVPFASPLAGYRGTVGHTYSGVTIHNLVKSTTVTMDVKDKFSISGLLTTADHHAEVKYKGVFFRDNLKKFPKAKILFINEKKSVLSVVINDSLCNVFYPESSPHIQEININSSIENLVINVTDTEGFIGYGVEMEGASGVTVDNYSVRGSSGLPLLKTNPVINKQINKLLCYDLIILQYGLNVMSPTVGNYDNYSDNLVRIVEYVKECFPNASVLIMGVGDRGQNIGGTMTTMPVIRNMIAAQRRAAEKTGVAFWNTFEAMGGDNSMVTFVKNNWAAKDFTHLKYSGGRIVANRFVESLLADSKSSVFCN